MTSSPSLNAPIWLAPATSRSSGGLLFTSDRSMPRHSDAIGRFVDLLDRFRQRHEDEDSYRNRLQWLGTPDPHERR